MENNLRIYDAVRVVNGFLNERSELINDENLDCTFNPMSLLNVNFGFWLNISFFPVFL